MILVGARIYHAFGSDHRLFGFLSQWNPRTGAPLAAFSIQGIISAILILTGRFESLIVYTSAAHWLFLMEPDWR
jgi:amino acid transporter